LGPNINGEIFVVLTGTTKKIIIGVLLVTIYLIAVYSRYEIAHYQGSQSGTVLPFTLESALLYNYADTISRGETVPDNDIKAQYPEGLNVRQRLSLSQEYVMGTLYRLFFKSAIGFHDFIRLYSALFFSLSICAVYLLVYSLTENAFAGVLSALFYAVCIPCVIRSTGQEIMGENCGLPLFFFHMWALTMSIKMNEYTVKKWLYALCAAGFLALSLVCWDMMQIYIYIFVLFVTILFFTSGKYYHFAFSFCVCIAGLVVAGLANPYLRWHEYLWSYPMVVGYSLIIMTPFTRSNYVITRLRKLCFILIVLAAIYISYCVTLYGDHYGHFMQLFWYKIRFWNTKPIDPLLLPYTVRSLWVPALHSVGIKDALRFFASMVPLVFVSWCFLVYEVSKKRLPVAWLFILTLTALFIPLYILFSRIEVFVAYFSCILIGGVYALGTKYFPRLKYVLLVILGLCFLYEADRTYAGLPQWGRNVNYPALVSLTNWIEARTPADSVCLATFGLSPSLLAYGKRAIVLHPKYEDAAIRKKVKEYDTMIFSTSEDDFYKICKKYDVTHYIHSRGTFTDRSINGRRYLAGVMQPSYKTNAYKFEIAPLLLTKYRKLYENDGYLVYKIVDGADVAEAGDLYADANRKIANGNLKDAIGDLVKAITINPGLLKAHARLIYAYSASGDEEMARRVATIMFSKMGIRKIETQQKKE